MNLAKRLAEAARGGQILISEALAASLDRTNWPLAMQEQELKGIGHQHFFEVLWRADLARLAFYFREVALVGRWLKLRGSFEIALVLSGDRHLRLEFNKEFVERLDKLPQQLEHYRTLRPPRHPTPPPAGSGPLGLRARAAAE